ncbi:hypothetical protein BCR37DRAFT_389981 [Protomyces lactucae-debilis]|uniref:Uncharacterized protein n=1 Tax=Protomyces lactucae-debilis TaxID=2754530 RepID=A0A1Y2EST4_PROLT|nr:uncharacterized protein BCR37DRAFT_389981 [Protomyces lactucae-debilis]ORY73905.1 hypothetical protein BCR37DRAFT_389981 [Protomyces lactucae-debilis]
MPDYFPEFMRRISLNPSLSFLMVSTYDTPEFCPRRGQSVYFQDTRHRVYCAEMEDIIHDAAHAMCRDWECSDRDEFYRVRRHLADYVQIDGQAWNNLKPLYPILFGHLFRSHFEQHFSHWFRIDLDVFLGRWDLLFPKSALAYDVITFSSGGQASWTHIWLKGYLTGFRNEPRVARQWLRMHMFANPDRFCRAFNRHTFDRIQRQGAAADEGAQTIAFMRDAPLSDDLSWVVLPGLLAVDLDLEADPSAIALAHLDILRVPARSTRKTIEALTLLPAFSDEPGVRVGMGQQLQLTQKCQMSWLAPQDRLCIKRPPKHTAISRILDAGLQVQIARDRRSGSTPSEITASVFPSRGLGYGTHILAYHFQASKNQGLNYGQQQATDEILVVGKTFASQRWWLDHVDAHGRRLRRYGDSVAPLTELRD